MGMINKRDTQMVVPDEPIVEIINDTAYCTQTVEQYGDDIKIVKRIPVMTKEVFIQCYETWILNNHMEDDHK